jgi:hypothetical protein
VHLMLCTTFAPALNLLHNHYHYPCHNHLHNHLCWTSAPSISMSTPQHLLTSPPLYLVWTSGHLHLGTCPSPPALHHLLCNCTITSTKPQHFLPLTTAHSIWRNLLCLNDFLVIVSDHVFDL